MFPPDVEGRQTTAVWKFWQVRIARVQGTSMLPTLKPGQVIFYSVGAEPAVGDVVVAKHPETDGLIVKRLTKLESDGYWLEGDAMQTATAASSSDSWVFGAVSRNAIVGVVLIR